MAYLDNITSKTSSLLKYLLRWNEPHSFHAVVVYKLLVALALGKMHRHFSRKAK